LFRPLIKKANRALLLTGSPALSRPIELHTQVNFICPGLLGKKKWYGLRYCGARETQYGWEYKGAHNLAESHLLLTSVWAAKYSFFFGDA